MAIPNKQLLLSDQFVISCGTVSVDPERSKVLLIRCQRSGKHMLPKGRKDIGEALEQTAMRETYEETGVRVELLPVKIASRATVPLSAGDVPERVTEPFAMSLRPTRGILKTIFWFVARADSTSVPEEGTQQGNEHYDTVWVDWNDVESVLAYDDDRRIARAAISAVEKGVADNS